MTFSQLRSFSEVARLGSVTRAAHPRGEAAPAGSAAGRAEPEPAVSAAVGALRRELGDELFVRASGGIHLTPGGVRLAGAAQEILMLAEAARAELQRLP